MSLKVEFRKNKKTLDWHDRYDSLLELARDAGINLESDCEQGFCGSCKIKLLAGKVDMDVTDGLDDDDSNKGMILPCVAVPLNDVVVDA